MYEYDFIFYLFLKPTVCCCTRLYILIFPANEQTTQVYNVVEVRPYTMIGFIIIRKF